MNCFCSSVFCLHISSLLFLSLPNVLCIFLKTNTVLVFHLLKSFHYSVFVDFVFVFFLSFCPWVSSVAAFLTSAGALGLLCDEPEVIHLSQNTSLEVSHWLGSCCVCYICSAGWRGPPAWSGASFHSLAHPVQ